MSRILKQVRIVASSAAEGDLKWESVDRISACIIDTLLYILQEILPIDIFS